jgi:hypothetical protein
VKEAKKALKQDGKDDVADLDSSASRLLSLPLSLKAAPDKEGLDGTLTKLP